jgi:hypothetical protein
VWQDEILAETQRNAAKVLVKQGAAPGKANKRAARTVEVMQSAFPDALLQSNLWIPLISEMANDTKDRHVLAAAVGAVAAHLVTDKLEGLPRRLTPGRPGAATGHVHAATTRQPTRPDSGWS